MTLDAAPRPSWIPPLYLLAAPALTGVALAALPSVHLGPGATAAVTFAGGAATGLVPLALAAPGTLSKRAAIAMGLAAAAVLFGLAVANVRAPALAIVVNLALVALGHAVGASIGQRVTHPGHLLPACVVAAAADVASVLHPSGPTRAIVESERALAVAAIGFPVPGTGAVAPVLGAGDLVFLAIVFGVVTAHRLSLARAAALGATGIAIAGLTSALLERPVPALVPIALVVATGLPAARKLRPEDRRVAKLSIAIAIAIVVGVVAQRFLAPSPPPG